MGFPEIFGRVGQEIINYILGVIYMYISQLCMGNPDSAVRGKHDSVFFLNI